VTKFHFIGIAVGVDDADDGIFSLRASSTAIFSLRVSTRTPRREPRHLPDAFEVLQQLPLLFSLRAISFFESVS